VVGSSEFVDCRKEVGGVSASIDNFLFVGKNTGNSSLTYYLSRGETVLAPASFQEDYMSSLRSVTIVVKEGGGEHH
jgi:hypothetical protein